MQVKNPELDAFVSDKLSRLEKEGLLRRRRETTRLDGACARRDGQEVISFSCNDYLGLSTHPALKEAAIAAVERYGAGAGASRLVTGDHPLYAELEKKLAALKGSEAAIVFGSGYLANVGIIPALVGPGDLILADELAHSCLIAGMRLSRAETRMFRHNDIAHAEELLAAERGKFRHCLILTETVFSMDGDRGRLEELAELADGHKAWLMTDDAHALGVLPVDDARVPLRMGTLSKAAGSYGGYLCASNAVCEFMRNRARSFIYTTGLPPAVVGASIAAIELIAKDADLVARPLAKARRFTRALSLSEAQSAVVPLIIGSAQATLAASEALFAQGFLVVAIRPPTVPEGTSRLRFAFSALHQDADIDRLVLAVRDLGLVK
jgi:8-amino-7-oxononanoate synthase